MVSSSEYVIIEHFQDSAGVWKSSRYDRCAFVAFELAQVRIKSSEVLEVVHHSFPNVLRFEAVVIKRFEELR